jgi:hypothetical protein
MLKLETLVFEEVNLRLLSFLGEEEVVSSPKNISFDVTNFRHKTDLSRVGYRIVIRMGSPNSVGKKEAFKLKCSVVGLFRSSDGKRITKRANKAEFKKAVSEIVRSVFAKLLPVFKSSRIRDFAPPSTDQLVFKLKKARAAKR